MNTGYSYSDHVQTNFEIIPHLHCRVIDTKSINIGVVVIETLKNISIKKSLQQLHIKKELKSEYKPWIFLLYTTFLQPLYFIEICEQ